MSEELEVHDRTGRAFKMETSADIRSFFGAESAYWSDKLSQMPALKSADFVQLPKRVEALLKALSAYEEQATPTSKNQWLAAKKTFIDWCRTAWVYRGSPFTEALLAAYEQSTRAGSTFLQVLTAKTVPLGNASAPLDAFVGAVMAYEHLLQDTSNLVTRRNAEIESFETLRRDMESARAKLIAENSAFRSEIETWKGASKASFDGWFRLTQGTIRNWLDKARESSERTVEDHSKLFNEMAESAVQRVRELESTYQEKLRFAAPADYWRKRAELLNKQGGFWAGALVIALGIMIAGAGWFFTSWLQREPLPFGLQTLQGVALFGATATAAIFLIRILTRLAFSAKHLQRDAEEREQLTHLYLSLIHEGALDVESRDIVLQALFSRTDSGLLGGDHAPKMPTPADVIAGVSRMKT